jgi:hypothetical protein
LRALKLVTFVLTCLCIAAPAAAMTRAGGSITVVSSVEGLDARDGGGVEPPDVQIAAGPDSIVEVVNVAARMWRTSAGHASAPAELPLPSILGVPPDEPLSDPRVIYDAPSGRFFLSILDERTNALLLAVSRTSDPAGAWTAYAFQARGCPDQPRLGVDDAVVVLAGDVFASCSEDSPIVGGQLWVVNKQQLLDGAASPAVRTLGPDVRDASLQPVRSLGSSGVEYVASVDDPFSNVVHLLAVNGVPPAATSLARLADVPITPLDSPPDGVQPESFAGVQTNDDRLLDAVWTGDRLWATANGGCTPVGDVVERACGRVLAIDTASHRLVVDAQISDVGGSFFYPALSLDGGGNVVIVYGTSSAREYPAVAAVARTPDGSFTQPVTIVAPGLAHSGQRYGDYFGAATDPGDPSIVWVAGQMPKVGVPHGWGTEIAAVSVSSSPGRTLRPDRTRPRVSAIASAGSAGSLVRLDYRVSDDSGRTRERVTVLRGKRTLAVLSTALGAVAPRQIYFVTWRAPRSTRGTTLRFCVRATDAAGNRSLSSCAPLRIR